MPNERWFLHSVLFLCCSNSVSHSNWMRLFAWHSNLAALHTLHGPLFCFDNLISFDSSKSALDERVDYLCCFIRPCISLYHAVFSSYPIVTDKLCTVRFVLRWGICHCIMLLTNLYKICVKAEIGWVKLPMSGSDDFQIFAFVHLFSEL